MKHPGAKWGALLNNGAFRKRHGKNVSIIEITEIARAVGAAENAADFMVSSLSGIGTTYWLY